MRENKKSTPWAIDGNLNDVYLIVLYLDYIYIRFVLYFIYILFIITNINII